MTFVCSLCQKKYKTKYTLVRHRKQHSVRAKEEEATNLAKKNVALYLQKFLPVYPKLNVLSFSPLTIPNNQESLKDWYIAEVEFVCKSEVEISEWIKEYQLINEFDLKGYQSRKSANPNILYKKKFQCQYSTIPRLRKNHLGCDGNIVVTLRKCHENNYSAIVRIKNTHSHSLQNDLKLREPCIEVKNKITKMLLSGKTVADALLLHKSDLKREYDNIAVLKNQDYMPDFKWAFRLYREICNYQYDSSMKEMKIMLSNAVEKFNSTCSSQLAIIKFLPDGENFIIALISPFMNKIINMENAGEIIYVDQCMDIKRYGCKIILLLTPTTYSGLPVGVLITSRDSEYDTTIALLCYKELFLQCSQKKVKNEPKTIVIGDLDKQYSLFSQAFPNSAILLSNFHILQTVWKCLWDSKTYNSNHRRVLFSWIKRLIYVKDKKSLDEIYDACISDDLNKLYPEFVIYVKTLYQRKQLWAVCLQKIDAPSSKSFYKSNIMIFKHKILDRIDAFNPLGVFEFCSNKLTQLYEEKLKEIAEGTWPNGYFKRGAVSFNQPLSFKYKQLDDHYFKIVDSSVKRPFYIDTEAFLCCCTISCSGDLCRHEYFLSKHVKCGLLKQLIDTEEEKLQLDLLRSGIGFKEPMEISSISHSNVGFCKGTTSSDKKLYTSFKLREITDNQNTTDKPRVYCTDYTESYDNNGTFSLCDENINIDNDIVNNSSLLVANKLYDSSVAKNNVTGTNGAVFTDADIIDLLMNEHFLENSRNSSYNHSDITLNELMSFNVSNDYVKSVPS